jgi:hypothetical protein
MHDAYERAAVGAGWETNPASRKPWSDVPEANQATMRAAVTALLDWLVLDIGLQPVSDGRPEPITTEEIWDAHPGPEIVADYIPALDGTAAVKGPSDAHPELRLAKEGYGDLEARLTAIVGTVDGEAYVSRIVSALIAAGVRFEHSDAP